MAIVFDSDAGTISGLSVGGLPDGVVDGDMLAANAITAGKIADGTIGNADINSSAAIASSKLVLPTGSVIQVKHATPIGLSGVNSTSSTLADTGLTVSITPSSSSNKMVVVNLGWLTYRGSNYPNGKVTIHSSLTNGTLTEVARYHLGENDSVTGFYAAGPSGSAEESLSSWSSGAITYKVQFASLTGANYAYSNWGRASLYVMEILG